MSGLGIRTACLTKSVCLPLLLIFYLVDVEMAHGSGNIFVDLVEVLMVLVDLICAVYSYMRKGGYMLVLQTEFQLLSPLWVLPRRARLPYRLRGEGKRPYHPLLVQLDEAKPDPVKFRPLCTHEISVARRAEDIRIIGINVKSHPSSIMIVNKAKRS